VCACSLSSRLPTTLASYIYGGFTIDFNFLVAELNFIIAVLGLFRVLGNRANSRGPWAGTRGLSKNNSALEATADDRRHIDKDKGTCETGVGRASLSHLRSS